MPANLYEILGVARDENESGIRFFLLQKIRLLQQLDRNTWPPEIFIQDRKDIENLLQQYYISGRKVSANGEIQKLFDDYCEAYIILTNKALRRNYDAQIDNVERQERHKIKKQDDQIKAQQLEQWNRENPSLSYSEIEKLHRYLGAQTDVAALEIELRKKISPDNLTSLLVTAFNTENYPAAAVILEKLIEKDKGLNIVRYDSTSSQERRRFMGNSDGRFLTGTHTETASDNWLCKGLAGCVRARGLDYLGYLANINTGGNLELQRKIGTQTVKLLIDACQDPNDIVDIIDKLAELKIDYLYFRQGISLKRKQWKGDDVSATWADLVKYAKDRILMFAPGTEDSKVEGFLKEPRSRYLLEGSKTDSLKKYEEIKKTRQAQHYDSATVKPTQAITQAQNTQSTQGNLSVQAKVQAESKQTQAAMPVKSKISQQNTAAILSELPTTIRAPAVLPPITRRTREPEQPQFSSEIRVPLFPKELIDVLKLLKVVDKQQFEYKVNFGNITKVPENTIYFMRRGASGNGGYCLMLNNSEVVAAKLKIGADDEHAGENNRGQIFFRLDNEFIEKLREDAQVQSTSRSLRDEAANMSPIGRGRSNTGKSGG